MEAKAYNGLLCQSVIFSSLALSAYLRIKPRNILQKRNHLFSADVFSEAGIISCNQHGLQGFAPRDISETFVKVDNRSLEVGHGKIK
jgi:hypothetical protein